MSFVSAHSMLKAPIQSSVVKDRTPSSSDPLISERTVRRFFGLVFGFAAIGLWLVPSAHETADVVLLKSGFTAILSFCCIIALLPRL